MGVIIEVRDPMADLEEKIKTHRLRVWRRMILTTVTLILAVVSTWLLLEVQTYTKIRTVQEYEAAGLENGSYAQYSTGVLKYSRDGIAFLDKKGEEQWNQAYQIKNPFLSVNEDSAVVADRGGNDILVFDKAGLKGEIHTNYPVERTAVSQNGIVAAILRNGNSPQVVCYDATGNVLVEHRASLTGTGYPIGLALSPDGTMLQVSYLCVEDGVQATRVMYFDFDKTANEEEKHQAAEDIYKNTVLPTAFFVDEKTSVLVGDKAFMIYKGSDEPKLSKTVEIDKEIKSFFYDKKYLGFVLKNSGEEGYELRLYSMAGTKKLSETFDGEFTNVKVSRENVILYEGKNCMMFSTWGVKKFEGEMDKDIMEILPLSGVNKYLVMNTDGIEEIRLVK